MLRNSEEVTGVVGDGVPSKNDFNAQERFTALKSKMSLFSSLALVSAESIAPQSRNTIICSPLFLAIANTFTSKKEREPIYEMLLE